MPTTTRHGWRPCKVMAMMLIALPGAPALACTTTKGGSGYVTHTVDIPIERADAPNGELLTSWKGIYTTTDPHFVDGCDIHSRVPFRGTLDTGSLRPVGTMWVGAHVYTTYELPSAPPSAPLLIFQYYASTRTGGFSGVIQPVNDLTDHYNRGMEPPAGGLEGRGTIYYVALVARGGAMRSIPLQTVGRFVSWPEAFPSLKVYAGLNLEVRVARATCLLSNQTVSLPDVSAKQLQGSEGGSAGETAFDIQMTCNGSDANTVRLVLDDALDRVNRGTELTPTPTTTAQGVRLQILSASHKLLPMGEAWHESVKKGVSSVPFFARYYRIPGDFRPGLVGGQATLTLTHF